MKILITGVAGMVASHLADLLIEKGIEIYGTYRWQEDMINIEHIKDKIKLMPMNLNDFSNVLRVINEIKPDAISHLAAESYVNDSFDHPEESIRTNTIGTLNILEAVRLVMNMNGYKTKVVKDNWGKPNNEIKPFDPVIHICSSSEVYRLVKKEYVPIKETQSFNPSNPYAVGKVGADMLALMYYTNYGLKTIRTRMFTHFSYRRKMLSAEVNFANQIATFEKMYDELKDMKGKDWEVEKDTIEFYLKHGNLNSVRTWADARDAVKAYYLILTQPSNFGEVYNIGGNTTKTIGEMLDYMISLSPLKDKIKKEQDTKLMRNYDVTLQIPDCSKFKKDYPTWKPEITFEKSIQDLLNQK